MLSDGKSDGCARGKDVLVAMKPVTLIDDRWCTVLLFQAKIRVKKHHSEIRKQKGSFEGIIHPNFKICGSFSEHRRRRKRRDGLRESLAYLFKVLVRPLQGS